MPQSAHLTPFRHRAAWLLVLGLLAVALHVLVGTGLMRTSVTAARGDTFAADVCTGHGLLKADSSPNPGDSSQPASGVHDCCKLCAAGAPLLVATIEIGAALAPTFATAHDAPSAARPTLASRTAHPPRGPPARA